MNDPLTTKILQDIAQRVAALTQLIKTGIASIVNVQVSTFANLPSVPFEGMLAGVSDSTTNTWGATITGGGSLHVLAYYDGTNWTVAGK